ncbi:MAG: YVTN family beta-propeller protein [Cyclobacteriaceae bacterium]|jgi:YVTN family beta-propeller protein
MSSKTNLLITISLIGILILSNCSSDTSINQSEVKFTDTLDLFNRRAMVGPQDDGTHVVATSQIINPAGNTVVFPGRPTDLALNNGETILAVKNKSDVIFFDVASQSIKQTLKVPEAGNTFVGIAWSSNDSLVWTTDTKGLIRSAKLGMDGSFSWHEEIALKGPEEEENNRSYPGGFVVDEAKDLIYVALSRNNSLGIVNTKTMDLEEQIPVGIAPFTIIIKGSKAYVTNWGGRVPGAGDKTGLTSGSDAVIDPKTGVGSSGSVSVVDLESRKVMSEIEVGLLPCNMVLSPDGSILYVANANSDMISVIDTNQDEVLRTIDTKPIAELPFGSAPNALVMDSSGKTLYVANGANNLLAVIDLATDEVTGLIPTGWYPGAVLLNKASTGLIVANVKGIGGRWAERSKGGYNSHDHMGSVSFIPVPGKEQLNKYSLQAAANMRLPKIIEAMNIPAVEEKIVPLPTKPGEKSVFKHVLYIIKENRTYDQVFGDLPQGNGDTTLVHFGREVTPNHHALAEEFVLLDNTYCNGVLSADGHLWAMEGFVTDYLEKSFGGFVRSYPYDGDDALAYAKSGFIWDKVLDAGLSFRDYGEFVQAEIEPDDATWTQLYDQYKAGTNEIKIKATTELHTLRPYLCPTYVGFPGKVQDVYRAGEFIKELKEFEKNDNLPNFMVMLLPNDHTVGTRAGYPTPRAAVADNDLALGQIVEAVSKSKFWKETAIFIIQDDPQAGLDHVDGRRTVAMCVSPYTKRGEVISTHYNQNSYLRTMELILGLSPMSQFDLLAEPLVDCFTDKPDFTPYTALPNQIPLDEMNPDLASIENKKQLFFAQESMKMPLDDIDKADEGIFNRIVWHSVRGYDTPYPDLASIRKKQLNSMKR